MLGKQAKLLDLAIIGVGIAEINLKSEQPSKLIEAAQLLEARAVLIRKNQTPISIEKMFRKCRRRYLQECNGLLDAAYKRAHTERWRNLASNTRDRNFKSHLKILECIFPYEEA